MGQPAKSPVFRNTMIMYRICSSRDPTFGKNDPSKNSVVVEIKK